MKSASFVTDEEAKNFKYFFLGKSFQPCIIFVNLIGASGVPIKDWLQAFRCNITQGRKGLEGTNT
jgi:hypothetical protein